MVYRTGQILGPGSTDLSGKTVRSLQALRAFATLIVVCFHLAGAMSLAKYFGYHGFDRIFAFGHAGVDLFFVLSGFLIFSIHRQDLGNPKQLPHYARKRLLRIFPSYWIVLATVAAMVVVSGQPIDGIRDWFGLLKTLLLLPQDPRVVGGVGAPILIVAWSLQYEICFYAVIGLFIVNRALAWAVLIGLVALALSDNDSFLARFMLNPRACQFMFGILSALLLSSIRIWQARWLTVAGVVTFVGAAYFECIGVLTHEDYPLLHPLAFGVASALLLMGLVKLEQNKGMKVPALMIKLGDSSYATYLIHFTLISILCRVLAGRVPHDPLVMLVLFPLLVGVCLAAGHAFYFWVEAPLLKWLTLRATTGRPPAKSIVSE